MCLCWMWNKFRILDSVVQADLQSFDIKDFFRKRISFVQQGNGFFDK